MFPAVLQKSPLRFSLPACFPSRPRPSRASGSICRHSRSPIRFGLWASRRNTNIVFDPRLVAGITAPALNGTATAEEALARLLAGTQVRFKFVDDKTVSLMPAHHVGKSATSEGDRSDGAIRLAQADSPAQNANAGQRAATEDSGVTLEEIVVTATKRTENVQTVASSVSVLSADALDTLHATQLSDYAGYVPGLIVNSNGTPGQSTLILRGIAPLGDSAAVSTYRR